MLREVLSRIDTGMIQSDPLGLVSLPGDDARRPTNSVADEITDQQDTDCWQGSAAQVAKEDIAIFHRRWIAPRRAASNSLPVLVVSLAADPAMSILITIFWG